MGKKRKAGGQPFGHRDSENTANENGTLRIHDWQDVADSEDEFHINQDKIFLEEGPAQKRQRKAQAEDEIFDFSDQEVLAGSPEISDSDPDDDGDEDEDEDEIEGTSPQRARKSNFSQKGIHDSGSETAEAPGGEDDDIGEWGTTKRDYYNADAIETEADALEEEIEVRRLQRKQLERLTEEDFGLDELNWVDRREDDDIGDKEGSEDGVIRELLPEPEISDSASPEERLKILRTRYPEFEPLSKEFVDLQPLFKDLTLQAEAFSSNGFLYTTNKAEVHAIEETPLVILKHRALSAYLSALCMYIMLLTSTHTDAGNKITSMPPAKLRDHSIMDTLVQCRELWSKAKDMPIGEAHDVWKKTSSEEIPVPVTGRKLQGDPVAEETDRSSKPRAKSKKPRKSKAQKALEAAQALAAAQRLEQLENNLRAFSALETQIGQSSKTPALRRQRSPTSNSSFGEQTTLNHNEAIEKAQRKKSLRFYTSQITQKSQKRDAAGRHAGGDTDIPHRERLRDRQARLNGEAESRGQKRPEAKGGDELGDESDDEDRQAADELRKATMASDDENGYYNLIGAQQAEKKARKQAAAAAAATKAAEQGGPIRIAEDEYEGGKRGLSYAIAKNKGLAPRRKKEVRNPRVKKRLKFEEKKRKLGSTRAVWKGGEGKGGYKGELTGIKSGLVRGVKL